jgi:hypothetical protein
MLGAASLGILLSMALQHYVQEQNVGWRGIRGSLLLWALLVMTNAAMRLASVSFIFGLAFVLFNVEDEI